MRGGLLWEVISHGDSTVFLLSAKSAELFLINYFSLNEDIHSYDTRSAY